MKIETLQAEMDSASLLLWAAIRTFGGKVDITTKIMEEAGNGFSKLDCEFSPITKLTTIRASVIEEGEEESKIIT